MEQNATSNKCASTQLISIHRCIYLQMQMPEVGINFIPLYRKAYRHTHSISNYHCTHYSLLLQALCNLYNKTKTIRCASDLRLLEVDGEPPVPARRRCLRPRSAAGSSSDAAPLLRHPFHLRARGTPARQQPNFSQRRTFHRSPPMPARGRQAKLAPTRNAPHRSAGARAAHAAAGAARGRRRRGGSGGGTSRRTWPWMRQWTGRGGAPGRRGARRRTPFGRFLSPQE